MSAVFFYGPSDHRIHIQLEHCEPPIWRRIRVPSELPLPQFARVIESAMGWESYHLHQFDVDGVAFGIVGDDFTDHIIDETAVVVRQILPREGAELRFDYDFGDDWHHLIRTEHITERNEHAPRVELLDGARSCPPEDVGGIWGYKNLLDVLDDPTHEEHKAMRAWAGKAFDPEHFDPAKVQRALEKLFPKAKPKRPTKKPSTTNVVSLIAPFEHSD